MCLKYVLEVADTITPYRFISIVTWLSFFSFFPPRDHLPFHVTGVLGLKVCSCPIRFLASFYDFDKNEQMTPRASLLQTSVLSDYTDSLLAQISGNLH